jgi:3-phosphoshikimate 1-carboxyvinyltransferase
MAMKQSIRTLTEPLTAQLTLPGSKSMTNRAFLLAALAQGRSTLSGMLQSADTLVFAAALRQLGVTVDYDERLAVYTVVGVAGSFARQQQHLFCADAGTAARFLIAACAGVGGSYYFDGSAQLRQRPLAPLIEVLAQQGVRFQDDARQLPLSLSAAEKLTGGHVVLEGKQSSQFTSGLLMAAPFFKTPLTLQVTNLVSAPYVAMTIAMMQDFGAQVSWQADGAIHVGVQRHYQATDYLIEPDLSTASYFFAAAAVTGGSCLVEGVRSSSLQGDVKFLDVLAQMGCIITETAQGMLVQGPAVLRGVTVNMCDFSDTFMTLAALACFADSATTITHIGHTRLQESDRISAMCQNLTALEIQVEEGEDWLRIFPGIPRAGMVESFNDHRIAMACAVIGLRVSGIEINGAQCVGKTCPDFFERWEKLS